MPGFQGSIGYNHLYGSVGSSPLFSFNQLYKID